MNCNYFGQCGSCRLYENGYSGQLQQKADREKRRFQNFYSGDFFTAESPESGYRSRAEFKIWHSDSGISYAMSGVERGKFVEIDSCPMVSKSISDIMTPLLKAIEIDTILSKKLFSVEFLSGKSGELLVTLLYHKKLDNLWEGQATQLQSRFPISIIGRSRKQKIVLERDYIDDKLTFGGVEYSFKQLENSFSQPNPTVNEQMVSWVLDGVSENSTKDLIELYCGSGNFTIPMSQKFNKVLATEVAKSGIATAKENMAKNGVKNIEFGRVSAEEFREAIDEVRPFNRLSHIDLKSYSLDTIFVDPPRAGVDADTLQTLQRFDQIIYISCNPDTLHRDLNTLSETHRVKDMALFDQFPYTEHLEMGAILERI